MRRSFPFLLSFALLVLFLALPAHAAQSKAPVAGDTWREPVTGMVFVWVPGGSPEVQEGPTRIPCDEEFREDNRVQGFWLGKFEVTQGQWRAVMGQNPAFFQKGDGFPVEQVSLPDAQEFIARLNQAGQARFRLPTATEWIFAAAGGGPVGQRLAGSAADAAAWHQGNSRGATHAVGTRKANRLGLYDMCGNVAEWTLPGEEKTPRRGRPPRRESEAAPPAAGDALHLYYGGSWSEPPKDFRVFGIGLGGADFRLNTLGLRLLRQP